MSKKAFRFLSRGRGHAARKVAREPRFRSLRIEMLEYRRMMATGVTVKASAAALAWFDTNVKTVAVRTLAKSNYQDGVLSRTDMIGLFRKAETLGNITTTLFNDLKAIVNNSSLFSGVAYVRALASEVVLGDPANAKYQGQALGNLNAGSTAAHLQKLVNKWFLGTDRPVGKSDWGPTYSYRQVAGTLFVNGASYSDVRQGGLGDCYLLAALAETALKNPAAVTSMFIVNGDSTYTVRYFRGTKAEYVTVDSQLPTDSSGRLVFASMGASASNSKNELWVALAEKAYVQMNASGWIRPAAWGGSGQNVYNAISGGSMGMALGHITSKATVSGTTAGNATTTFTAFASAFNSGKSICLGSNSSPPNSTIVGGHAYAVLSVNTTTKTVTVFNPWGLNNGHDSGVITLSWSQIQSNFGWFDRTV